MGKCQFQHAYRSCGKDSKPGLNMCEQHSEIKCCVCGAPATHECWFHGQFVCGAPLCDECEMYEMEVNYMGTKEHGAWGTLRHGHRRKVDEGLEVFNP